LNGNAAKELAISDGRVSDDGVPYTRVILDAGWDKRTKGHDYNAKAGHAVIIDAYTKKVLFVSSRNKYCYICSVARTKKIPPQDHLCYLNWNGSSSGMEQDMIIEGFVLSLSMHGLRYLEFIGDGDSSVYQRIIERVAYGKDVIKHECANHVTKNFTRDLYNLVKNRGDFSKILTKSCISSLTKNLRGAIKKNREDGGNTEKLKCLIKNVPFHVFGDHQKCSSGCSKYESIEGKFSRVPEVVMLAVNEKIGKVLRKASNLLIDSTTNLAESFMRVAVKFLGHKQVCRSKRNSHAVRITAAALATSHGSGWHSRSLKSIFTHSPTKRVKKFSMKREKLTRCARRLIPLSFENRGGRYKARLASNGSSVQGLLPKFDSEYGQNCQKPDLPSSDFKAAKEAYLAKMTPTKYQLQQLPSITAGQSDNPKWVSKRMESISSTRFYSICVRRPTTSTAKLVEEIVTGKQIHCTWQMKRGIHSETVAIKCFEEKMDIIVQRSDCFGLFADQDRWWLVTSPDGICDAGIVEVKTVTTIPEGKTIKEAVQLNLLKGFFLRWDTEKGCLILKREHKYFYQIQGQLNILDKENCFLVVFVDQDDFEIISVKRDICFWKQMLPKLDHFWDQCLLPELVDPRLKRSMKVRELPEVLEAQSRLNDRKRKLEAANVDEEAGA
jgi:hypothetical protein